MHGSHFCKIAQKCEKISSRTAAKPLAAYLTPETLMAISFLSRDAEV
jgi:hypothetical protein